MPPDRNTRTRTCASPNNAIQLNCQNSFLTAQTNITVDRTHVDTTKTRKVYMAWYIGEKRTTTYIDRFVGRARVRAVERGDRAPGVHKALRPSTPSTQDYQQRIYTEYFEPVFANALSCLGSPKATSMRTHLRLARAFGRAVVGGCAEVENARRCALVGQPQDLCAYGRLGECVRPLQCNW